MSSIVLDIALERNKSPFFLSWNIRRGYSLLQKYEGKVLWLGATHDEKQALEAYRIHVAHWLKNAL
jgi:hypothetical protein